MTTELKFKLIVEVNHGQDDEESVITIGDRVDTQVMMTLDKIKRDNESITGYRFVLESTTPRQ